MSQTESKNKKVMLDPPFSIIPLNVIISIDLSCYFCNKSLMIKTTSLVILLALSVGTITMLTVDSDSKTPPIFNYSYQVNFKETFISKKGNTTTNGKLFYDPINKR